MGRIDSVEQASEFGREALELMAEHGVAPHPENFTVWYDYVAGRKPELAKALDVLISNKVELTEGRSQEIFQQYYSNESLELGETYDRLAGLISQVSDRVGIGASDQSEYCDRFGRHLEGHRRGGERRRALVAGLRSPLRDQVDLGEDGRDVERAGQGFG